MTSSRWVGVSILVFRVYKAFSLHRGLTIPHVEYATLKKLLWNDGCSLGDRLVGPHRSRFQFSENQNLRPSSIRKSTIQVFSELDELPPQFCMLRKRCVGPFDDALVEPEAILYFFLAEKRHCSPTAESDRGLP